ncbi:hypothetical protein ES703_119649 [subsurface metagenome]
MVFWDTCLQTSRPRPDSILRASGLLDGSVPENHAGRQLPALTPTDGTPGDLTWGAVCVV